MEASETPKPAEAPAQAPEPTPPPKPDPPAEEKPSGGTITGDPGFGEDNTPKD